MTLSTVGSSLMLQLAMDKIAMENIKDQPKWSGLPGNVTRIHLPGWNNTFEQMIKRIVDEVYKPFTLPEPDRFMPITIHVSGIDPMPIQLNYGMLVRQQAMNVEVHVGGQVHIVQVHLNDDSQDDIKKLHYTTTTVVHPPP